MGTKLSKEQKRLAAIFLALMGIIGTIVAMKDRQVMMDKRESQIESQHPTAAGDLDGSMHGKVNV